MDKQELIAIHEEKLKQETENLHNFYMSLVEPEYKEVVSIDQLNLLISTAKELGGLCVLQEIRSTIDENFEEKED